MYLLGNDYRTVWQLAHIWVGRDSDDSDPHNLAPEVKESIHRILIAIKNQLITVRTTSRVILADDSFLDFLIELPHILKINACVKKSQFDKNYLDSLYVWRPEVLRWCQNDQLPIPAIWQSNPIADDAPENENEDADWLEKLSPRRKRIVAVLHIAQILWQENQSLSYEEVWNHPDMKKYDKPRSFPSLDSFKTWTKSIAPQEAKAPGKRNKTKV